MLFMDWRDSHLDKYPDMKDRNQALPTFLYAMPFTKKQIFFEETSLVARPPVPFDELKRRLYARLQHLGVSVRLTHAAAVMLLHTQFLCNTPSSFVTLRHTVAAVVTLQYLTQPVRIQPSREDPVGYLPWSGSCRRWGHCLD
jgi:hypothetical protein